MGLDSSNRDISATSAPSHSGSLSPSTVSLHRFEDHVQRGTNSSRLYKHPGARKTSRKESIVEFEMEGTPGQVHGHGAAGDFEPTESQDEPNKPQPQTEQSKTATTPLLPGDSSSDDSSDESEESSTLERRAPDGGWGWVVVAAAFFINMVADGVTFSFGAFFVTFTDHFKQSKSATAWIGSLLAAMPLLSGPIASLLADRYGCRKVTVAGGLLASLGFILSSFATSIGMLYVTFGMITGVGLSLCYVAAVVSVAYYFEQRRSLATGISVCGGGIGTFIFAPLTQLLIKKFGWQNATRILSIPFLYLCCCGLVMRDLEWTKKARSSRKFKTRSPSPSEESSSNREITTYPKRLYSSAICIPTFVPDQERPVRPPSSRTRNQTITTGESIQLSQYPESHSNNSSSVTAAVKRQYKTSSPRQTILNEYLIQTESTAINPNAHTLGTILNGTPPKRHQSTLPVQFHPAPTNDFAPHRHSLTYRGAVVSLKRYRLRPASSCPDIISVATTEHSSHEWKEVMSDMCKWVRALFEWRSLSCSRRFIVFVLSNFLLYMWYDVVYIYLQDSAMNLGYSESKSSYLISILGLFNMVGNLSLGYMGDKEGVDATLVYGICMILCGISVLLLPMFLNWSYVILAIDCGLYGLAIAANYSLTSVILVKVVSLERFATAYGLLLLVQGIGNLIGPPIAGLIYDFTTTSFWSFWVAGVGILLSSLFILIPTIFSKCSKPNDKERKEEVDA